MKQPILSILICSLKKRKKSLERLLKNLENQKTDDIEILVEIDEGEITIGAKRQKLLERARGLFCCFLDDDDDTSPDYVSSITKSILGHSEATGSFPDCVGLEGEWILGKASPKRHIFWGLEYDWHKKGANYYIGTNHITPVKREIALQAGFPDISSGEDQEYGRKVREIAKTEVKINKQIYFYLCDPTHQAVFSAKKRHGK